MKLWKRARELAPAVLLLAIAAAPYVAAGSGQLSGTLQAGTDLVGTLPSFYTPPDETGRHVDAVEDPTLQLNAPLGVLDEVIKDAYGDGYVLVVGPDDDGDLDLRFHGSVAADLDPPGLKRDGLEAYVRLGTQYEGGVAVLETHGAVGEPFLVGSQLRIPFEALFESGLLEEGGLTLHLMNRRGATASFHFVLEGDVVVAAQEVH